MNKKRKPSKSNLNSKTIFNKGLDIIDDLVPAFVWDKDRLDGV